MSKIIGIDLGTTNSVVSVMEGGEPIIIANSEGGRTTPSVVAFPKKEGESRKVGVAARRQSITNAEKTIYSIKRFIGKSYKDVEKLAKEMPYTVEKSSQNACLVRIGERTYTPQEISAMILQKLKTAASDYLGTEVHEAVITVPAYFNDAERQATKEAGEIAGLKVLRIINEPTAAALAYGLNKKDVHAKIVVYDLGGGTFDVSILELGDGVFEVKSTHGDVNLGGDNFDGRIIDWIVNGFKKDNGINLKKDLIAMQRLRDAAEKAKIELSTSSNTEINLPFITASAEGPKHLVMTLSRSELEKQCHDLIERTLIPCQKALKAAGMTKEDIDEVVLVGGSTRIPKIQEEVEKFFGKKPSKGVNADEVVALGAAVQGGILGGDVKGDVLLLDVTPLSLGIETAGGVFTKLIEANTTIPTKKSEIFSTAQENQTIVDISVLQGERSMAKDNKVLGRFYLDGIPVARRGVPKIEVTFDIDANGLVHVSAKDQNTGKKKDIRIESSGGLSKEEIAKMKEEAELYAEEDKKEKEKADKLNKTDATIFRIDKEMKEHGDKISADNKKKLEKTLESLKKAHASQAMEEVDTHMQAAESLWLVVAKEIHEAKQAAEKGQTAQEDAANKEAESAEAENETKEAEFEEVK